MVKKISVIVFMLIFSMAGNLLCNDDHLLEGFGQRLGEETDQADFPDDPSECLKMGKRHLDNGNYSKALNHFRYIKILKPTREDFAQSFYYAGLAYARLEKPEEAIDNFTRSMQILPNTLSLYSRGLIYEIQDNLPLAIKDFSMVVKFKPDFFQSFYRRGMCYARQENYSEALNDFTSAINLKPDFFEAWFKRGKLYLVQGTPHLAVRDYSRAVQIRPDFLEGYHWLAISQVENKQYEDAIETYLKMSDGEPRFIKYAKGILKEKKFYHGPLNGVADDNYLTALKACVRSGRSLTK